MPTQLLCTESQSTHQCHTGLDMAYDFKMTRTTGHNLLGSGELHQFYNNAIAVVPEPSVVLMWLAGCWDGDRCASAQSAGKRERNLRRERRLSGNRRYASPRVLPRPLPPADGSGACLVIIDRMCLPKAGRRFEQLDRSISGLIQTAQSKLVLLNLSPRRKRRKARLS